MTFITININHGEPDPAAFHRIETQLANIMSTQVAAFTAIKAGINKVGGELTAKIDELIAAQGTLTPEAQVIADEITAKIAALDSIVPDAPPAEEPPTGEQATS